MREIDKAKDEAATADMILVMMMGTAGMFSNQETVRLAKLANVIMMRAFVHIAGESPERKAAREVIEADLLVDFETYVDEQDVEMTPSSVDLLDYISWEEREALTREAVQQRATFERVGPPPLSELDAPEEDEELGDDGDTYEDDQPINESDALRQLLAILGGDPGDSGRAPTGEDCSLCDAVDCPIRTAPYDPDRRAVAGHREDN